MRLGLSAFFWMLLVIFPLNLVGGLLHGWETPKFESGMLVFFGCLDIMLLIMVIETFEESFPKLFHTLYRFIQKLSNVIKSLCRLS